MAFNADTFQPTASLRARSQGRQEFNYDAEADLLATVIAADFFLGEFSRLQVGDTINCTLDAGLYRLEVLTSAAGGVTVGVPPKQALSGAGAVDTITDTTEVTSTGADALTLIDGAEGQVKKVIMIVDGGDATLTPTTGLGFSTIVFADAGDSVLLQFASAGGWAIIGSAGLAGGPVAA